MTVATELDVEAWADALASAHNLDALLNLPKAESRIEAATNGSLEPTWARRIVLELMAQGKFRLDKHSPEEAMTLAKDLLSALDAEYFTIESADLAKGQSHRFQCNHCHHHGPWTFSEDAARKLYFRSHLRASAYRLPLAS